MKRFGWGVAGVLVVLAAFGAGVWVSSKTHRAGESETSRAAKPVSNGPIGCVKTVPIVQGTLDEQIVVYGSVVPSPGALQTITLPFQSRILALKVSNGQKVGRGEALLEIEPGPDAALQLEQARHAFQLLQEAYQGVQRRYDVHLATNEQLLQARQAMEKARVDLESLTRRGIDGPNAIKAQTAGLVQTVAVQQGAIVAAGQPLMGIVAENQVEVLLGVEPEDIGKVHPGMQALIRSVNAPSAAEVIGRVRKLSYAVNPATRLVDVFISLDSPDGFLLQETVSGKIVLHAAQGLIVPRSAVLPEQDRRILFTVREEHAVKHTVRIGLENAQSYQIEGGDLEAGEPVVVEGNYELTDGMKVTTGPCP